MACMKQGLEYIQTGEDGSGFIIGVPKTALTDGLDISTYMEEATELMYKPVMEDGLIPITVADSVTNCLIIFCSEDGELPSDEEMNRARSELCKRLFSWVEVTDFATLLRFAEILQGRKMQFYAYNGKYYIRGAADDCTYAREFGNSPKIEEQYCLEDNVNSMTDFTQKLKNFIEYEKR